MHVRKSDKPTYNVVGVVVTTSIGTSAVGNITVLVNVETVRRSSSKAINITINTNTTISSLQEELTSNIGARGRRQDARSTSVRGS